ncbi:phage tail tape measure protein [Streptomyces scabiei]|uniref:phage tail tape measure protein n=1 Tax=Streptomyces scabiei TaxID=1930 RepID=UPI001B31709F|nr:MULTISPECIES: phage tail tape measure protein [Streptomyces]MDX2749606.1 phage tail tape measure protein [Streptomyces scabiei]MDX3146526.1 phage tail tape measure protein [Streptomyces scabiei]MDX3196932.1 phage tail tape measure protein [Streptomyces scabiei]
MTAPLTFGRPFVLQRDHDVSGVSGVGIVADGCCWPDGTVAIRWRGDKPSTVFWDRLDDAIAVHGHGGSTRVVWADDLQALTRVVGQAVADAAEAADVPPHLLRPEVERAVLRRQIEQAIQTVQDGEAAPVEAGDHRIVDAVMPIAHHLQEQRDRARNTAGRAYLLADRWQAAHGAAQFLVRAAGAELRDVLDECAHENSEDCGRNGADDDEGSGCVEWAVQRAIAADLRVENRTLREKLAARGGTEATAECPAKYHSTDAFLAPPRPCIRPVQHDGDHIDGHGFHWSVAVQPAARPDPKRDRIPDPLAFVEVRDPCPYCEGCPLVPRHEWDAHMRAQHPEIDRPTVHACPPLGSGLMPCCGRTPFEATGERLAMDPRLVTCQGVDGTEGCDHRCSCGHPQIGHSILNGYCFQCAAVCPHDDGHHPGGCPDTATGDTEVDTRVDKIAPDSANWHVSQGAEEDSPEDTSTDQAAPSEPYAARVVDAIVPALTANGEWLSPFTRGVIARAVLDALRPELAQAARLEAALIEQERLNAEVKRLRDWCRVMGKSAQTAAADRDRWQAETVRRSELGGAALTEARATGQRLNRRAQVAESGLATVRRAVAQWEIDERGTYVPLRTIAAIAKAVGRDVEDPRWILHHQRVEQAETALAEAQQVISMQKNLIGSLRSIVATAMTDREDQAERGEACARCGRDHIAELEKVIREADVEYRDAFPPTADGPAWPGRLPDGAHRTPRQRAYEAVQDYIDSLGSSLPSTTAGRTAHIWIAVNRALEAAGHEAAPDEPQESADKPVATPREQYRFATTWAEYNAGRKAASQREGR